MIPRLQQAFGGDPMGWLSMPQCVVLAHIEMLPRLRAERRLEMAEAARAAQIETSDYQRYISELERQAGAVREHRSTSPDAEQLAALGIATQRVPAQRSTT